MAQPITGALYHDANHNPIGYNYRNITTTTPGILVKSGIGILHLMTFNTPSATAVITLYDSLTASGATISQFTVNSGQPAIAVVLDITFQNGLTIVVSGSACDITVSYV